MTMLARAHMVSFLCYLCLLPELFLGRYFEFLASVLLTSCVHHCAFASLCSQFHTLPPRPQVSLWSLCGSIHNPVVFIFCILANQAADAKVVLQLEVCVPGLQSHRVPRKRFLGGLVWAAWLRGVLYSEGSISHSRVCHEWVLASSRKHTKTRFLWCNWPDFF